MQQNMNPLPSPHTVEHLGTPQIYKCLHTECQQSADGISKRVGGPFTGQRRKLIYGWGEPMPALPTTQQRPKASGKGLEGHTNSRTQLPHTTASSMNTVSH